MKRADSYGKIGNCDVLLNYQRTQFSLFPEEPGARDHKEVQNMSKELFVKAEEVASELGISKPYAYKLVREMNEELKEKGFITIPGRVSRRYFEEKFYGLRDRQ